MASVRNDIAFGLAEQMLDEGLIAFAEKEDPNRLQATVTGTVGVASKRHVATLEERVAERQMEIAERLVDEAVAGIHVWNSHHTGDEGSISKGQAADEVRRAFKRLAASAA